MGAEGTREGVREERQGGFEPTRECLIEGEQPVDGVSWVRETFEVERQGSGVAMRPRGCQWRSHRCSRIWWFFSSCGWGEMENREGQVVEGQTCGKVWVCCRALPCGCDIDLRWV